MVTRITLSVSDELAQALDALATGRRESRSQAVETLLRESNLVHQEVQRIRGAATAWTPRLKKGRTMEELEALARFASRQRLTRTARGQVVMQRGTE